MDLDGSAWWVPNLVVSSPTQGAPSSTSAWRPSTFSSSKELLLRSPNPAQQHCCYCCCWFVRVGSSKVIKLWPPSSSLVYRNVDAVTVQVLGNISLFSFRSNKLLPMILKSMLVQTPTGDRRKLASLFITFASRFPRTRSAIAYKNWDFYVASQFYYLLL